MADHDPRMLFREVAALSEKCRNGEALDLLAAALRRDGLDAEECVRAGRIIAKLREASGENPASIRVLLLGQSTTCWIAAAVTAIAWGRGWSLDVREGAYDNLLQDLLTPGFLDQRPQVIVLLPWNQRLLGTPGDRQPEECVGTELEFWRSVWDLAAQSGARILQIGYDWITPGALGHCLAGASGGYVAVVREMNRQLRGALPRGSFFVDLEQVSGMMGRDRFYEERRYFWTKQPFSEQGVGLLARHLWAGIRALMSGPKKVLVVDLDNTLWGGVVGETGPLGISIGETPDGEAYRAFQTYLKDLTRRGVLLTVCSKNNPEDAAGPFEQNPQMVLSLDDFAHFEASWEAKSEGLRRIAEALQLGLDSFVFFDDNPAEREQVRRALPQVEVVEAPQEPAEFVRSLQAGLWFEAVNLSAEDFARAAQYRTESRRRETQNKFASLDDYLESLEMRGSIAAIGETNLERVVQLIGKTNQFNLTTRRHSREEVERILDLPASVGLTLNLEDKFGDHGLIAVLLAVPAAEEAALLIDTWLMSCRVIGRTAEDFLFNELSRRAVVLGYEWLLGEFVPTKKNAMVTGLLDRLGFERLAEDDGGTVHYRYSLSRCKPARTFIDAAQLARA